MLDNFGIQAVRHFKDAIPTQEIHTSRGRFPLPVVDVISASLRRHSIFLFATSRFRLLILTCEQNDHMYLEETRLCQYFAGDQKVFTISFHLTACGRTDQRKEDSEHFLLFCRILTKRAKLLLFSELFLSTIYNVSLSIIWSSRAHFRSFPSTCIAPLPQSQLSKCQLTREGVGGERQSADRRGRHSNHRHRLRSLETLRAVAHKKYDRSICIRQSGLGKKLPYAL